MDSRLILLFAAALLWRIFTLVISTRNERVLKAAGAREFGSRTSKAIGITHAAYYLFTLLEGYFRAAQIGETTFWGIGLYLFSMLVLAMVWHDLGNIWTVKIYIAPNHKVSRSWLFRTVRHPNYFLNIIPELVGLALILRAWVVLVVGLPMYGLLLAYRIREEERAMRSVPRSEDDEVSQQNELHL